MNIHTRIIQDFELFTSAGCHCFMYFDQKHIFSKNFMTHLIVNVEVNYFEGSSNTSKCFCKTLIKLLQDLDQSSYLNRLVLEHKHQ